MGIDINEIVAVPHEYKYNSDIDLLKRDISESSINLACEASKKMLHNNIDFREQTRRILELYSNTGVQLINSSNG